MPKTPQYEMNSSYYDDESDKILSDVESGIIINKDSNCTIRLRSCQTNLKPCCPFFVKGFFVSLLLATVFLFLYILYIRELISSRNQDDNENNHLLKENYNENHRQLTVAGVIAHNRHTHTCDDYQFGCCEIYTDCSYNKTDFTDYKVHTFYHVFKHNKEGTNCPRLKDLVIQHNRHYPIHGNASCETYEQGCYQIETECDIRVRFLDVEAGSEDDIQLYKRNIHMGHKYTSLVERKGIESKPSIQGLMIDYQEKYPSKDFDIAGFITLLSLLLLCVALAK